MIYEGIIAAWTALNNTIRHWSRTFAVQKELILVVESNPVLRGYLVDVLRNQQYRTIEACGGAEAVRIGARCNRQIHLLMTAVRLPDLIGWELEELLRFDHPVVEVVYVAHDRDDWRHFGRKNLKCILLQAPFRPEEVLEVVHQALSRSATGRGSRTYKSRASADACSAAGSIIRFPTARHF
jgi:DNA-binding response OmpR family regulator